LAVRSRLVDAPFDADRALGQFLAGLGGGEGAVVSFVGLARLLSKKGSRIERLTLDHHPRLTKRSLARIASAAAERFDVSAIDVIHRCGEMKPGEVIVFVAAAGPHRRAAFEAADYLMDRLKTEAVFWKREDAADGSRWIDPTDADYADRNRWER